MKDKDKQFWANFKSNTNQQMPFSMKKVCRISSIQKFSIESKHKFEACKMRNRQILIEYEFLLGIAE